VVSSLDSTGASAPDTLVRGQAAQPMSGKTVVVTGSSNGIGEAAARQFAALGARVLVVSRSPDKTVAVAESIGATPVLVDFARLDDVRRAADEILELCPQIDVLANNAGAMFPTRTVTEDGFEMTFQVNHLAGFLLTGLLLPRLTATPGSRVITTSSMANRIGHIDLTDLQRSRRKYRQFAAYADSKLANVLTVREMARRMSERPGGGPTASAFHPGFVASHFGQDTWYIKKMENVQWARKATITTDEGAAPMIALAVRPDPHTVNGVYLHRFTQREALWTNRQSRNPELARQLWDRSAELVGLPGELCG
jgi:NAD(P)-dependent dehydrogenase (short-subunit alcohol dehydrogenase family)